MKNLHIHLGSWKSASTLIQTTLRKNAETLAIHNVGFADQYEERHKQQFSVQFRKAVQGLEEHGITSEEARAYSTRAARLFEELGVSDGVKTVLHSWENFVGHPFNRNSRTLYHGPVSAYWFDRYLSHLSPTFTFITRNQADLIEAMYTQEVRKGRFLDTIEAFLDRFVKGRDLSWLPVVEPFISRFGSENVRIIPFEDISRIGTEAFLEKFFDPILDFRLENSVQHSNPSFSAKAVEIALKTYPGLSPAEIRKEEARLVREYSNLKYPRSDFLGIERRDAILESVKQDNMILFDRYIPADYAALAQSYQPSLSALHQAPARETWLDRVRQKLSRTDPQKLWSVNINGQRKSIPLIRVDAECENMLPRKYAGRQVLLSQWNFHIPVPKGEPLRARFHASREGEACPGMCLDLIAVNHDGPGHVSTLETQDGSQAGTITRSDVNDRYAAVVSHDGARDLRALHFLLDMSEAQKTPSYLEFTPNGVIPGNAAGAFAGYARPLTTPPAKIASLVAISSGKAETEAARAPCPEGIRPFFLTIDTESFYFKRPVMMTGEGLKGAKASYEMLDELDKHGLKAVFYVNVYEHLQYDDDSVEKLCKDIHERGHEVALHCHKSASLDFYDKDIVHYGYDGQRRILEYGKQLIQEWLGNEVINFRAGGYQHNADTLAALQDLGFRIDSSYFYRHSSAPAHDGRFVQPYRIGKLIEVPVLYLPVVMPTGLISDRKLDINSVNLPELLAATRNGTAYLPVLNYMMHSFSFIARQRFPGNHPDGKLLMRSPSLNSRGLYMGVTDLRDNLWRDFCAFLKALAEDDGLEVRTMASAVDDLERIVDQDPWPEVVPIIYR